MEISSPAAVEQTAIDWPGEGPDCCVHGELQQPDLSITGSFMQSRYRTGHITVNPATTPLQVYCRVVAIVLQEGGVLGGSP
jgi:hypothetical protein